MSDLRTPDVDTLLRVLARMEDEDQVFALLEDLMTIREIKETSQRLVVARMLDKGDSYAVIEKGTGASATTIARVSKALNYGAGGYRAALDVLAQDTEASASAGVGALADSASPAVGFAEHAAGASVSTDDAAAEDGTASASE